MAVTKMELGTVVGAGIREKGRVRKGIQLTLQQLFYRYTAFKVV